MDSLILQGNSKKLTSSVAHLSSHNFKNEGWDSNFTLCWYRAMSRGTMPSVEPRWFLPLHPPLCGMPGRGGIFWRRWRHTAATALRSSCRKDMLSVSINHRAHHRKQIPPHKQFHSLELRDWFADWSCAEAVWWGGGGREGTFTAMWRLRCWLMCIVPVTYTE